jgi:hypothetical protein
MQPRHVVSRHAWHRTTCGQDLPGEAAPALFVSRSGKTPGAALRPDDLVQVRRCACC